MSSKTNFVVKKGDLFQGAKKGSSFAHCISKDVKLGKGISVLFRERYGNIEELRYQNSDVGDISTIMLDKNCFVYNLITKEKFNGKPSYESLEDCLLKMRHHAIEHCVREISCPKLGCGLDNLREGLRIISPLFSGHISHLLKSFQVKAFCNMTENLSV